MADATNSRSSWCRWPRRRGWPWWRRSRWRWRWRVGRRRRRCRSWRQPLCDCEAFEVRRRPSDQPLRIREVTRPVLPRVPAVALSQHHGLRNTWRTWWRWARTWRRWWRSRIRRWWAGAWCGRRCRFLRCQHLLGAALEVPIRAIPRHSQLGSFKHATLRLVETTVASDLDQVPSSAADVAVTRAAAQLGLLGDRRSLMHVDIVAVLVVLVRLQPNVVKRSLPPAVVLGEAVLPLDRGAGEAPAVDIVIRGLLFAHSQQMAVSAITITSAESQAAGDNNRMRHQTRHQQRIPQQIIQPKHHAPGTNHSAHVSS